MPRSVGALVLVALFDHVSGALIAAGLLAVAGARRDRDAWTWRAALVAAGAVWAAVWGLVLVDQLHGQWASWIPHTTPWTFATTVSRQVTLAEAAAPIVLAAVIGGGVVLCRRDRVLGRMWLALGVLPFALAAVIGVFASFLFDRTLTLASWAPLMAIAYLLDAARRRWRTVGTAIVVTVMLIVTLAIVHVPARQALGLRPVGRTAGAGGAARRRDRGASRAVRDPRRLAHRRARRTADPAGARARPR